MRLALETPHIKHSAVRSVQEMLNFLGFRRALPHNGGVKYQALLEDGVYGPNTESAVVDFQRSEGLLADGIVGSNTMKTLEAAYTQRVLELNSPGVDTLMGTPHRVIGMPDRHVYERVAADKYGGEGYDRLSLRDDVAAEYRKIYYAVHAQGALLTSSGGLRSIHATVTRSRSATSFHYLGRALDLFIYSGMIEPEHDPYVVSRESERTYRVYARCSKQWNESAELPAETTVKHAITYKDRTNGVTVQGHFLDLTALFKDHGFERIRARRRFEEGASMMGAEWWHFQYERGLTVGQTTFGYELLKVYSKTTLENTGPWAQRDRVFGVDWF